MRLPDFMIIGGQRCGSTWLYRNLRTHPRIFLPEVKELEFFSHDANFAKGMQAYAEFFAGAQGHQIVGEATPSYLWCSEEHREWADWPVGFDHRIPDRVAESLGTGIKLIAILRDPVDRAVSAYLHHVRRGRLDLASSILDVGAKAGIAPGIVHIGFYGSHLSEWIRRWPRENLHVLVLEEVTIAPERALEAVCRFLDVEQSVHHELANRPANRGLQSRNASGEVYVRIASEGETQPADDTWKLAVSAVEVDHLVDIYRSDVTRLSVMLGRDLAHVWRRFA